MIVEIFHKDVVSRVRVSNFVVRKKWKNIQRCNINI